MKRVRAVISGRVQGVWFRGWTLQEAEARGLDGWVRNRRDGSVEAVLAGAEAAVDDMLRVCHDGPPAARVFEVEVFAHDDAVEPGFRYLPNV